MYFYLTKIFNMNKIRIIICKWFLIQQVYSVVMKESDVKMGFITQHVEHGIFSYNGYGYVRTIHFKVPEDTYFVYVTFEGYTHTSGSDKKPMECPSEDIFIVLKSLSFPIANPKKTIFPPNVGSVERVAQHSVNLTCESKNKSAEIFSPLPGDWFAVVFLGNAIKDVSLKHKFVKKKDYLIEVTIQIKFLKNIYTLLSERPETVTFSDNDVKIFKFNTPDDVWLCLININIQKENGVGNIFQINIRARAAPVTGSYDVFTFMCGTPSCSFQFIPSSGNFHYLEVNKLIDDSVSFSILLSMSSSATSNTSNLSENGRKLIHNFELIENYLNFKSGMLAEEFMKTWNIMSIFRIMYPYFFSVNFPNTLNESEYSNITLSVEEILLIKFQINSFYDTGGSLNFKMNMESYNIFKDLISIMACVSYGTRALPIFPKHCVSSYGINKAEFLSINTTSIKSLSSVLNILYPEAGDWYLTFKATCFNKKTMLPTSCKIKNVTFSYSLEVKPCLDGECGDYGICYNFTSSYNIYSACDCLYGYTGWACSDDSESLSSSEMVISTFLLTVSNMAFIATVYIAIKRTYIPESIVYASLMVASTLYHTCDGRDSNYYTYCIIAHNILQFSDFFLAILSMWVTNVAISGLTGTLKSVALVIGGIGIAIGTNADMMSIWVVVVPFILGTILVSVTRTLSYRIGGKCYPNLRYWKYYFPAGLVLVCIGFILFGFVQTVENYKYVHSTWHVITAVSTLLLLPDKYPENCANDVENNEQTRNNRSNGNFIIHFLLKRSKCKRNR